VAEQFLDRAQVGTAFEQVGGEGVTQAMWMRQQPSQRACVQAPASRREEERVLGAAGQFGARAMEVARQPVGGLLAERNHPLLAALPVDVDELLLEVDVAEIEVDGLAAAQPGRVDELSEGTVSQPQRAVPLQGGELRVDLLGLRGLGQPARLPRSE